MTASDSSTLTAAMMPSSTFVVARLGSMNLPTLPIGLRRAGSGQPSHERDAELEGLDIADTGGIRPPIRHCRFRLVNRTCLCRDIGRRDESANDPHVPPYVLAHIPTGQTVRGSSLLVRQRQPLGSCRVGLDAADQRDPLFSCR